jgi:hypothetical protein
MPDIIPVLESLPPGAGHWLSKAGRRMINPPVWRDDASTNKNRAESSG